MVRIEIEVSDESTHLFEQKLARAMSDIGFEPRQSAGESRFYSDLFRALRAKGMEARDLVDEYRKSLGEPNG
jgi:hypothetical protein